jgi:hypothetical protein
MLCTSFPVLISVCTDVQVQSEPTQTEPDCDHVGWFVLYVPLCLSQSNILDLQIASAVWTGLEAAILKS